MSCRLGRLYCLEEPREVDGAVLLEVRDGEVKLLAVDVYAVVPQCKFEVLSVNVARLAIVQHFAQRAEPYAPAGVLVELLLQIILHRHRYRYRVV